MTGRGKSKTIRSKTILIAAKATEKAAKWILMAGCTGFHAPERGRAAVHCTCSRAVLA